jgi:alkylation response protein AidB-like acyl-CoA dehydrogenase
MATVDSLLEKVKAIAPTLRRHTEEAETARRLSRPVVDAMRQAGLYHMARPQAFGGLELDPVSMFRVVEEVARHDSAAGWTLNLSLAVDSCLAWLPDAGAADILEGHLEVIFGTSFTPTGGQAIPVAGGYRLTGQWPFVSGAHDARWFLFLPRLMDGDQPRRNAQGAPRQLWAFLPADQAIILDTWHTLGMRGTGSHDVALSDVFVPARHTAPLVPLEQPGKAYEGPLYRLTIWPPVALIAPPALGVARAAIDDLLELARTKTPSYMGATLGARQVVQRQLAEAAATLGAGRAYLHETFRDNYEAAVQGAAITLERKLTMQLATTHANLAAAKAVDLVHAAAGTSAIRNEYRFQQYFRDAHTMTQHAYGSANRYESVGALMLDLESDWPFFAF